MMWIRYRFDTNVDSMSLCYTQSVSIIRTHPFISENFQKVRYIENSDISGINSLYYYNNPFWISIPVYRDFTYCPNYRKSELSRPTVYIYIILIITRKKNVSKNHSFIFTDQN